MKLYTAAPHLDFGREQGKALRILWDDFRLFAP
jgi:hypothetical protein